MANYYRSSCLTGLLISSLMLLLSTATAISCTETLEYLIPCQSFLLGIGTITAPCCQGAQALSQAASSPTDKRSVCQCLKQAASSVNLNQDNAKHLPQLCNVNVPVPIQPDVDCDSIQMSDDVTFRYSQRYKNLETQAFRPTTSGKSPGICHGGKKPPAFPSH